MTWQQCVSRRLPQESAFQPTVLVTCDDCGTDLAFTFRDTLDDARVRVVRRLRAKGWSEDPVTYRDRCPDCTTRAAVAS